MDLASRTGPGLLCSSTDGVVARPWPSVLAAAADPATRHPPPGAANGRPTVYMVFGVGNCAGWSAVVQPQIQPMIVSRHLKLTDFGEVVGLGGANCGQRIRAGQPGPLGAHATPHPTHWRRLAADWWHGTGSIGATKTSHLRDRTPPPPSRARRALLCIGRNHQRER